MPRAQVAQIALVCLLVGCAAPPKQTLPAEPVPAAPVPAAWKEGAAAQPVSGTWRSRGGRAGRLVDALWRPGAEHAGRTGRSAATQAWRRSVARLRGAQAGRGRRTSVVSAAEPGLAASGQRAQATPGSSPTNSQSLGLNASWEIDLWGRVAGSVDAAQASAQASNADLAAARLSLQALVAQKLFRVACGLKCQEQLLASTLAAYDESRTLTRNRVQAGVAPPSDADAANARLGAAHTAPFPGAHALSASAGYRCQQPGIAHLGPKPGVVAGATAGMALFGGGRRTAGGGGRHGNVDLAAATATGGVIAALQEVEDALSDGASPATAGTGAAACRSGCPARVHGGAKPVPRAAPWASRTSPSAQADLLAGQRSLIEMPAATGGGQYLVEKPGGGWALHALNWAPFDARLPSQPCVDS
ncbi:MAG: TolC family protein [Simplicispira sp.]|nr:TolC family protein [Simplicispira sp.]